MEITKVELGNGLVIPKDAGETKTLKDKIAKYLKDVDVLPAAPISYTSEKKKFKVTVKVSAKVATITKVEAA